jgi:hypothetical protein
MIGPPFATTFAESVAWEASMRRVYSLLGAVLLLGCMDAATKTTGPSEKAGTSGAGDGHGHDPAGAAGTGQDRQLALTLLTGGEEVPVRATPADGHTILTLSDDGQSMAFEVWVNNIANVTQAHIHLAPRGANGGIVVWFYPHTVSTAALPGGAGPFTGLLAKGTFTAADFRGALAGQPMSALVDAILAGNTYANVHTDDGVAPPNTGPGDFPGGEIRGQLEQAPQ